MKIVVVDDGSGKINVFKMEDDEAVFLETVVGEENPYLDIYDLDDLEVSPADEVAMYVGEDDV